MLPKTYYIEYLTIILLILFLNKNIKKGSFYFVLKTTYTNFAHY